MLNLLKLLGENTSLLNAFNGSFASAQEGEKDGVTTAVDEQKLVDKSKVKTEDRSKHNYMADVITRHEHISNKLKKK